MRTAADLLDQVRVARAARDAEEVRILLLALEWADRHVVAPAAPEPEPVSHLERTPTLEVSVGDALRAREQLGLPEPSWHAGSSFAAALGLSTAAGDRLLRDALILSLRLPRVFARVVGAEVPVWRARRVAEAALGQPGDVVTYLDQEVADVAEKVGVVALDRIIDTAMLVMYPEEREIAQLEALDSRYVTLREESINDTGVADMSIRADWADRADWAASNDAVGDIAALLGREGGEAARTRVTRRTPLPGGWRSLRPGPRPRPPRGRRVTDRAHPRRHFVAHLTEANLLGMSSVATGQSAARLPQRCLLPLGHASFGCGARPAGAPLRRLPGLPRAHGPRHLHPVGQRPSQRERPRPALGVPYCTRPAERCDCDHIVALRPQRSCRRRPDLPVHLS